MGVNGISNKEKWTKTVKFSAVLLKVVFDFVVFEPLLINEVLWNLYDDV